MPSVRIAGLDSGKARDSSALVGCKVESGDGGILRILNAKRWLGRNYLDMEQEVASIHRNNPFHYVMIEINSVGSHVYEVLKFKYNMPAFAVTTAKDIKDIKKIAGEKTMDKNAMVALMIDWFSQDRLVFPENTNAELTELKRQLSIFAEHRTDAGNISYYAEGSEHDDLVMALMLCCFKARPYMGNKKRAITTATRKFNDVYPRGHSGRTSANLGSGIPAHLQGRQSTSWSIYNPR